MAIRFVCPKCSANFSVAEAFPGSKVDCPECKAIIITELKLEYPSSHSFVKPAPGTNVVDPGSLRSLAFQQLERWLDIPERNIAYAVELVEQKKAYETWKIPKGESIFFREITAPCEPLKSVQRRILDRLLYKIPVSNAAHGFVPGRSIVTNASLHLKTATSVLNVDLKDAFPSVDAQRVKHLYVRYLKIPLKHLGEIVPHNVLDEVIELLLKLTTHENKLPQGGPCSGYLLNIACITLDKNIYRILSHYGNSYRYTRYADDITISAPTDLSEELRNQVQKTVLNNGFKINPRKLRYTVRTNGQRLEITGLILEKGKVRIPAKKLDIFRATIYQAANSEPATLLPEKKLEIQSILAFVKMVYGRVPPRIWTPYKTYIEKHGLPYPRKTTKSYLDLYSGMAT